LVAYFLVPGLATAQRAGPMVDEGHPLLLDVGHTKRVTSLALSPDATELASSSEDGTVRLFNAKTGRLRSEIPVAGEVFSVAFSPDGSRLATGSTYNLVKLWDVRTATRLETFQDNRTWVTGVAFSPDGRFLASCDTQAGVIVRDLARGTVTKLTAPEARRVAWRADGRELAVVAGDRFSIFESSDWEQPSDGGSRASRVAVASTVVGRFAVVDVAWNGAGGELAFGEKDLRVTDLRGGSGQMISPRSPSVLAFSSDGKRLAFGGRDGAIEIYDRRSGRPVIHVARAKARVTSLLWSHDAARLFAGDEHGAISAWSVSTGQRIFDIPAQTPGIWAVAWGPHDRLATPRALWDLSRGTIVAEIDPPAGRVSWCGNILVTLGPKEITWRQGTTGAVLATAPSETRGGTVTCSPDGRRAVTYGYGIEVWNTADHTGSKLGDKWVASVAWGPGDRVAVGFEHALEIWRLTKNKPIRELRRGGGARVLAWRADGLIAADIGAYHRIDADWIETGLSALHAANLATTGRWLGTCIPSSLDHCEWDGAAWSPDGARLATIVDRVLSVVETPPRPKRSAPTTIPEKAGSAAVSWSPDGEALAVADALGVVLIRLRDAATVRLREVRVDDRIRGLVDDGHGQFCGDSESSARVVMETATGSGVPLRKSPSRAPDLLARFLGIPAN
jgi:WD40 repeat protein